MSEFIQYGKETYECEYDPDRGIWVRTDAKSRPRIKVAGSKQARVITFRDSKLCFDVDSQQFRELVAADYVIRLGKIQLMSKEVVSNLRDKYRPVFVSMLSSNENSNKLLILLKQIVTNQTENRIFLFGADATGAVNIILQAFAGLYTQYADHNEIPAIYFEKFAVVLINNKKTAKNMLKFAFGLKKSVIVFCDFDINFTINKPNIISIGGNRNFSIGDPQALAEFILNFAIFYLK